MANSGEVINDDELALRKAEEAASRRFQASAWLRQMDPGVAKGLPESPSEEEFCLSLRNGLILCNVLNRVNPGSVSKVVENPVVTVESTDAAAQSAIQYFENMRNFLVAVAEMKLLTFEASDIEKGGSSIKVVDCILCLKGYYEWRLAGGIGVWRYGGIIKITSTKGWNSPLLEDEGADGSCINYTSSAQEPVSDILNILSESCLKESNTPDVLGSLFDQFGLQLLQSFLMEWTGAEDSPLNPMLIDMVLERALKELYMQLVSQKTRLASHLKRKITDDNMNTRKSEFIREFLRYFEEYSGHSPSCLKFHPCGCAPNINNEERLELQQKQLEKLKLSFHEMKLQVECSRRKWEEDFKKFEKHVNNLESTSSSYSKLLEENRSLYNQVQDLKGNIRVYCRVRPFLDNQLDGKSTIDHIGENGSIMIMNPHKQGKDARKIFSFNKVFGGNTTQCDVFVYTEPLIRSVMDGYNVCIFAYGQTGSGKTYTMSGPDTVAEETWGVNYRALRNLFDISKSRTSAMTYDVSVQMIEIYNEQVRDLLVSDGTNRRLEIRNNSQLNGLNIPSASLVSVNCTQDVLDLMKIGQGNRAIGATALNERSSRSHSVLTVHVQGTELVSGTISRGCLHLVDLAGSERVDKSEATGERLKEAQHINRSLSALGDVISALAQKSSHIPYRNSKLTQVLQDALGGQAKTLMFVHINPEVNSFGETISTLKFAERVGSIELGAARANKETGEVRDLKEEVSKLKSALETKESEVVQMKILRTASPLSSQKYSGVLSTRPEVGQRPAGETRHLELSHSGSCSSGKQRKPRYPLVSDKELLASVSPFSLSGENYTKSRKRRSPSPPVRRSFSTDRSAVVKTVPKIRNVDGGGPVLKLRFPEKAAANIPTALSNENSRVVLSEQEEEPFKPVVAMRKPKAGSKMPGTEIRGQLQARKKSDDFETENECGVANSTVISRLREMRLQHHATRMSQNMEPRNFVNGVEPLLGGRAENKPPTGLLCVPKEGSKIPIPEVRRSRSLPRGKFTLS